MLDMIIGTLTQGLIYALLSYGIYITYKILDFPDLTVDGSFPLGAAVTAVLLVKGFNPYLHCSSPWQSVRLQVLQRELSMSVSR